MNLHGIFKRAMKVWGLPRNPVAEVERPRYRISDDVDAFSPEEVHALVRGAGSEQDAAMFITAAFTGLRLGELLALQDRPLTAAGNAKAIADRMTSSRNAGRRSATGSRLSDVTRVRRCLLLGEKGRLPESKRGIDEFEMQPWSFRLQLRKGGV